MRITAPITDYIPQSILTTKGDLAVRGIVIPERLASGALGTVLKGKGAGIKPAYGSLEGTLNHYLKAQGAGAESVFELLHLDDTGVACGNFTRNSVGDLAVRGIGYQTSALVCIAVSTDPTKGSFSIGWYTPGNQRGIYQGGDTGNVHMLSTKTISIVYTAGNVIEGEVLGLYVDGFDIRFVLTGTASCDVAWLLFP